LVDVWRRMQQQPQAHQKINQGQIQNGDVLFDRKVDLITAGLQPHLNRYLNDEVSMENPSVICDYITTMKTGTNLLDNYRKVSVRLLIQFSIFHKHKLFNS
jgi:hypothetical protein